MAKPEPRQRRQRGSINADDIVAGAFEVARSTSLDQLSMPILAEHLDVGVTSIYWYFRRKEDLLNKMTDVAVQSYLDNRPTIPPDATWQEMLLTQFRYERATHRSDQVLSDLLLVRTSSYTRDATRRLFQTVEEAVARLVEAGFPVEDAWRVQSTGSTFTRGMILSERLLRMSDTPTLDERQRGIMDWSSMPLLESLLDHPLAGTTDEDFEFGMARLMEGFELLLEQRKRDGAANGRTGNASAGSSRAAKKPIKAVK